MRRPDTDSAWRTWAERDPYYAVLTDPSFHADAMDSVDRERFFATGRAHLEHILGALQIKTPGGKALDYGCGVGRVLLPMAEQFDSAHGLDIAPAMLSEAARNAAAAGIDNVALDAAETLATLPQASFELVHSALVLQHIHPRQGQPIIDALAERVRPGGALALQFPYETTLSRRLRTALLSRLPALSRLKAALAGRSFVARMEMYPYDLDRTIAALRDRGFAKVTLELSQDHDLSTVFVFARRARLQAVAEPNIETRPTPDNEPQGQPHV